MRFSAIGFSKKHLDEDGRFHFGYAVVRDASHGLTEQEFEQHIRVLHYDLPTKLAVEKLLHEEYYKVLCQDAWQELITDKRDVPNNIFKHATKADKWDARREVY